MPHKTLWKTAGIIWEFSGVLPLTEVAEVNAEFYSDPRSDDVRYQIFDGTAIDTIVGSEQEAKMLAAIDGGASRSIPNLKVALVIKEPMLELAEAYKENLSKFGSGWHCEIFYSMDKAKDWVAE